MWDMYSLCIFASIYIFYIYLHGLHIYIYIYIYIYIIAIIRACACWALFVVTLTNTVHLIYIYIYVCLCVSTNYINVFNESVSFVNTTTFVLRNSFRYCHTYTIPFISHNVCCAKQKDLFNSNIPFCWKIGFVFNAWFVMSFAPQGHLWPLVLGTIVE